MEKEDLNIFDSPTFVYMKSTYKTIRLSTKVRGQRNSYLEEINQVEDELFALDKIEDKSPIYLGHNVLIKGVNKDLMYIEHNGRKFITNVYEFSEEIAFDIIGQFKVTLE